jgi:membrane glycosyltransferase
VLVRNDRLFFKLLNDAGEEPVDDFATIILRLLHYEDPDRVIHQRKEISFVMSGQRVDAKPDVCVLSDTDDCILLVQEDQVSDSETCIVCSH